MVTEEEAREEEEKEEEVEEVTGEEETMALMPKDLRLSRQAEIETTEVEGEEEAEVTEAAGEVLMVRREEVVTDQEPAEAEVKDLQEEVLVKKSTETSQELPQQPSNLMRTESER